MKNTLILTKECNIIYVYAIRDNNIKKAIIWVITLIMKVKSVRAGEYTAPPIKWTD